MSKTDVVAGTELGCALSRLRAITNLCRNRGGNCDCIGRCKAIAASQERLAALAYKRRQIEGEEATVNGLLRRLNTPPATLRDGFRFTEGLTPVAVFDCGEICFGYEDAEGNFTHGEWPFNEDFIWHDDCERFGIRVE